MPNTVDVSFKTHSLLKKLAGKNAETENETMAFTQNFSKKGLGTGPEDQDTKKTYLRVFSTSADEGKEFKANVSEIFTSGIFTS